MKNANRRPIARIVFAGLPMLLLLGVVASTGCMEPPGWKGEATVREYDVPGSGVLSMEVPEELSEEVSPDEERGRLNITYGKRGDDPRVTFGVRPGAADDPDYQSPSTILKRLEGLPEIRALENGGILGYYYTQVDEGYKPRSGDYKYVLIGHYRIGDFKAGFSVFTNNPDSSSVERALTLLAGATITKDAGSLDGNHEEGA